MYALYIMTGVVGMILFSIYDWSVRKEIRALQRTVDKQNRLIRKQHAKIQELERQVQYDE
ncbi:hypothetical protein [Rossellomorea yichunensis]|uniref:hypothetical protein n=1 Tax=Rossellomorea yichunensis TaxID=3077331 RepID=UPI0028DE8CCB|nr:hypothetical protein [Rossellomorea sp. YC4-1]MDT9027472.1 hypothetical protein [Rossellomorea sp. YC4-1]